MLKKYLVILLFLPLSVLAQPVVNSGGQTTSDGTLSYSIGETNAYFSNLTYTGFLSEYVKDNVIDNRIISNLYQVQIHNNFIKDEIKVSVNSNSDLNRLNYAIYSSSGKCYQKNRIVVPDFIVNYACLPKGVILFVIYQDKRIIKSQKIIH